MAEKVVDQGNKIWERGREAVMLRVALTGRGGGWDLGSGIGRIERSSDISKGERERGLGDIGISGRLVGER